MIQYATPYNDNRHTFTVDFDLVDKTEYGGHVYKKDAGKWGEGFVWYLGGDMSVTEAAEEITKLRESKFLENGMLMTSVEFMFYSNNVKTGIIYSYDILKTAVGKFNIRKEVQVFLPLNYNTSTVGTKSKLITVACFYLVLCIMSIHRGIMLKDKFRSLFWYRLNEFWSSDITTIF